ncbi:MAG: hypothetical protein H5T60_13490, partial [Anaerolineae bacterium]|nr:hypothetical protein [Anaerolineae bacterium]
ILLRAEGAASLAIQAHIISSMEEHRFWQYGYFIQPYDPQKPPRTLDDIWPGFAHETHQPPLYYWLAGRLVRWSGLGDAAAQLRLVRWFSALLGAGIVVMAWLAGRRLFPHHPGLAAGIAAFTAGLPMFAFIHAAANNDNLAAFFSAGVFVFGAGALRERLTWGRVGGMLACAVLALLTKRTGFIAPAAFVLILIGALWPRSGGRRWMWITAGILAGLLVTAGGIMLWPAGRALAAALWRFFHLPRDVVELLISGEYAEALVRTPYLYYSRLIFESFWARFGWLNVRLAEGWYVALLGLCTAAGAGLLKGLGGLARGERPAERYLLRALVVYLLIAIAALVLIMAKEVLYLSYRFGVVPQGRYLFPALIPLSTLFVWGMREWVPAGWYRLAGWAGGLALLLFDALCLIGYVIPFYH